MKRNANTTAATKAAVAQHTTTERKSAERSTTMRNANTATANTATATKRMTIDADTGWKFTPASIALNGHVFAADKYAIAEKGDVYVLAKVEGVAVRIHVGKASPVYHEALEAAVAFTQPKAEKPAEKPAEPAKPVEPKAAEPAKQAKPATKRKAPAKAAKQPKAEQPAKQPAEQPAAEPAKPVEPKAAEPAKQAKPATKRKAPAKAAKQPAETKPAAEPAKPVATADAWIGTTIEGKGWRIVFDDAAQRTRVIVDDDVPNEERVLIAVADAGFFWSNTTKSWNKKLTRKAYRAAKLLAETLNAIK